ncbi:MAG: formylglycine-generating enzyme family protein [Kiritimatiellae bacterium]|nr:formylglycine-generating enzyme family protein [Kiritimatiellia bacterium]
MNMKPMLCVATSTLSTMLMASDTPEVSNVQMNQSSTGRKVMVTYQLSNAANGAVVTFDVETNKTGSATNVDSDWVSIGGAAVCNAQGAVWRKVTNADADGNGLYTITWRPDMSWEGHKVELAKGGARAVVTAWALDNPPDYMVVDVSSGAQPNTQRYYPSASFLPGAVAGQVDAVTNNAAYKTTKLLMRKIMAKDVEWTMGSTSAGEAWRSTDPDNEGTHQVVLTNNYYIGVFEVTQSQWGEVAPNSGVSAFYTANRSMRPMEKASWNKIRGSNWPAVAGAGSFLKLLNDKTGLDFDLPSEAQWEYAARAGHGSGYWNDGSTMALNSTAGSNFGKWDSNGNLTKLGRFIGNHTGANAATSEPEVSGTAIVGSYAPSSWGLYDMHGNVYEFCLDWYEDNIADNTDAAGVQYGGRVNVSIANPARPLSENAAGDTRVARGGAYPYAAKNSRPAARQGVSADLSNQAYGFRVVCPVDVK